MHSFYLEDIYINEKLGKTLSVDFGVQNAVNVSISQIKDTFSEQNLKLSITILTLIAFTVFELFTYSINVRHFPNIYHSGSCKSQGCD